MGVQTGPNHEPPALHLLGDVRLRPLLWLLIVKVHAGHNFDGDDRRRHPVDDEAERRPPTRVCDELTAVLPQVLQPMACEATTSSQGDPVTAAAATMTKTVATLVSTTSTLRRPSATAKPM